MKKGLGSSLVGVWGGKDRGVDERCLSKNEVVFRGIFLVHPIATAWWKANISFRVHVSRS